MAQIALYPPFTAISIKNNRVKPAAKCTLLLQVIQKDPRTQKFMIDSQ